MPLRIPPGMTDKYFLVGKKDDGTIGAALVSGQSVTLNSVDPATVAFGPIDDPPLPTDEQFTDADGDVIPAGTVSIASGSLSTPKAPAQVNVAIQCTATLANADGSPILDSSGQPIPPLVDTVTVVVGLKKVEGFLFGSTPVAS